MSNDVAVYRLKEDDPRFGMSAGDLLLCTPYFLDPGAKGTVITRITDGFNPDCNVYWGQVEKLSIDRVFELRDAAGSPLTAKQAVLDAAAYAEKHIVVDLNEAGDPCLLDGDREVTVHGWLRGRADTL